MDQLTILHPLQTLTTNTTDDASLTLAMNSFSLQESRQETGSSEEIDSFEETDSFRFPRCEYYTRFGSAFKMESREYWGTYHRSTQRGSRYTKNCQVDGRTFENEALNQQKDKNKCYSARTGNFYNPYHFPNYQDSVKKRPQDLPPPSTPIFFPDLVHLNPSKIPYETLLDYRNQICLQVRKRYLSSAPVTNRLQIIHHNNYPYLLIKIPFINGIENIKPFNELWIAYYVAIVNHNAKKAKIPIEMVIRSSFGHLMPSIDSAGEAFRINVGIVPELYGGIVAQSLVKLQEVLLGIVDSDENQLDQSWLTEKNQQICAYNNTFQPKSISLWKDRLFDTLKLKGDKASHSVAYQLVRLPEMRDLLADYLAEELDQDQPNFTSPLVKMLDRLTFDGKVSMQVSDTDFKRNHRKWEEDEDSAIAKDFSFWKLIKQCVDSIGGSPTLYTNRQVMGLYAHLDKCNQDFIIRSASTQAAEDGVGSDSDCEDEATPLYYKKIILHTGMMAIHVAHYVARDYVKRFLKAAEYRTECTIMYYETTGALQLSAQNHNDLATLNNKSENDIPTILFFDLNHCDKVGAGSNRLRHYLRKQLNQKLKFKVVVLDYTSASKAQIKCAIDDALAAEIELILLVNSGLKNEQFGADNNPYGTVRIITKDKNIRDTLYDQAKQVVALPPFPSTAHKIRKGYKQAGMVLTNQIIAREDHSFKSLSDIQRYKDTIINHIQSSQQIVNLEKDLTDLIVITLKGYVEDWVEEECQEAKTSYQMNLEYWCDDGCYGKPPDPVDLNSIRNNYGNLDDVDNLLTNTNDDELSQIAYDNFYDDYMVDEIIEGLTPECDRLNLSPELMRSIFHYCDFQFDLDPSGQLDPLLPGFLLNHLVYNLTLTFCGIEDAFKTGKNQLGRASLHQAIEKDDNNGVSELVVSSFFVNQKNQNGEAPLHIASSKGNIPIMCLLIKHGANLDLRDSHGHTPLDQARDAGQQKAVELLESHI